jgi:hypothetical protein
VVNDFMKWYLQKFLNEDVSSSQRPFGIGSNHNYSDWMNSISPAPPWLAEMMKQMFHSPKAPSDQTSNEGMYGGNWIQELIRQSMQGSPFSSHTPQQLDQRFPGGDMNFDWIFGNNQTSSNKSNVERNRYRGKRKY